MKLTKLLLSLIILLSAFINNVSAVIDADVSLSTYYQDKNPFLEVSLHIVASTLDAKILTNGNVQTRVNILMTIKQDGSIIDFEKYALVSPEAILASDFIDLRRFVLRPGKYTIDIEITDQLNNSNVFESSFETTMIAWKNELLISDISLLYNVLPSQQEDNPFYKYGNILEPAAFSFFHQSMETMYVFAELYSTDKKFTKDYAVRFNIKNIDANEDMLNKFKRYSPSEKQVVLEAIPINDLQSGNYILTFDIINSKQEVLLSKSIPFQRSNPNRDREILLSSNADLSETFVAKLSADDLEYNLKALAPRLHQSEIETVNILLKDKNLKGQRFYLFNYWTNYDQVTTEQTFNQYWDIAKAVDRKFYNTVGKGFETDRGYIFLKYGKPNNSITVENEPSAPPYEIWFYDRLDITGENNVKFLFYNPTLGGYNFELLHSTTRNERQNKQWEVVLYGDAPKDMDGNSIDATTVVDNVNRRAREYFNDNN